MHERMLKGLGWRRLSQSILSFHSETRLAISAWPINLYPASWLAFFRANAWLEANRRVARDCSLLATNSKARSRSNSLFQPILTKHGALLIPAIYGRGASALFR